MTRKKAGRVLTTEDTEGHRGGRTNPKKEGPEERVAATLYSGQLGFPPGSISVLSVFSPPRADKCDEGLQAFRNLCSRARTRSGF